MSTRVFICFDGSAGSARAIEAAGRLFPGARTVVAHAWQRPPYRGVDLVGLDYGGQVVLPPDVQVEVERAASESADSVATHGASLANEAGLDAEARPVETDGSTWRALLAAAEDVGADVIVAGSRGRGELRSMVLGSTSAALSHHSRKPLLIVPGPGGDE